MIWVGQAGALTRLVAPPRVASCGVDGALQGGLQGREVRGAGEGPGDLERRDVGVVPVQAGVAQGQCGVHGGLLHVGEQRRGDELADVRRGGAEGHRGREVAGARHGEERRCDGLGDVACRLAGRHVQGQLVHDTLQSVGCGHRGQRRVVGRSDAAVHGS